VSVFDVLATALNVTIHNAAVAFSAKLRNWLWTFD